MKQGDRCPECEFGYMTIRLESNVLRCNKCGCMYMEIEKQ